MKRMIRLISPILFISLIFVVPTLAASKTEGSFVIKLGHHHNVGGILDMTAHKFAELAKEKSQDRLKIEIYPGAQLGQEREASEGILMGTLQMALISSTIFVGTVPGFGVDTLPFLLTNNREKNHWIFNESPVGKELENRIIQKGGRILGWLNSGFRHMLFIRKEIKSVGEMKGLKMRSPQVDLFVNMYRAIGARPTPITWGEVYTACQAHIVDGLDAPFLSIKDARLYEVAKYWLLTGHMWGAYNLIINEKLYQEFPEDIQKVIVEAGREAINFINQQSIDEDKNLMGLLKEKGMVFNSLSQEESQGFKKAMAPVIDDWAKKHDAVDIVDMIRKQAASK